ncbi:hypothetical protein AVEN_248717-1, partial [Araneus ventricosus]
MALAKKASDHRTNAIRLPTRKLSITAPIRFPPTHNRFSASVNLSLRLRGPLPPWSMKLHFPPREGDCRFPAEAHFGLLLLGCV